MSKARCSVLCMRLIMMGAAALIVGCNETPPWLWTTFLDPTKVSAGYNRQSISQIQRSLSFEDTPPGVPGAEEPTVEDTVAIFEDYRIGVGDQLELRSRNFLDRGFELAIQTVVSDAGEIQLPNVGWIKIEGLTAKETEQELQQQAISSGMFTEGNAPPIQITVLSPRQKLFNISGAIQSPGPYRILEPDFRLIDALSLAGGMPEQSDWIYVYRSQARPRRGGLPQGQAAHHPTTRPATPAPERATPPVAPAAMSDMPGGRGRVIAQATSQKKPVNNSEDELIQAVAPATSVAPASSPVQANSSDTQEARTETAPSSPKFIYKNGEWVDVSQQASTPAAPSQAVGQAAPLPGVAPRPSAATSSAPVTWESVASEDRQRVIQIPVDALRRGEARYNVVIRHRDLVRVDPGPQGEFFLFGNIARPGAYSMTGRDITLKQAVASAGGLDLLAWPSRCEVVRRLDQDREQIIPVNLEQIFMGNQDDVYLRPGDIVNVGSNIIAPFLATIRSSFRMSYGFGFVYDRNYGDIDSFSQKANPENVADVQKARLFPGLFQQ